LHQRAIQPRQWAQQPGAQATLQPESGQDGVEQGHGAGVMWGKENQRRSGRSPGFAGIIADALQTAMLGPLRGVVLVDNFVKKILAAAFWPANVGWPGSRSNRRIFRKIYINQILAFDV